jgi:hypothetical protein
VANATFLFLAATVQRCPEIGFLFSDFCEVYLQCAEFIESCQVTQYIRNNSVMLTGTVIDVGHVNGRKVQWFHSPLLSLHVPLFLPQLVWDKGTYEAD